MKQNEIYLRVLWSMIYIVYVKSKTSYSSFESLTDFIPRSDPFSVSFFFFFLMSNYRDYL